MTDGVLGALPEGQEEAVMKDLIWNYYFFVEAEGNISSVSGQNMLRELSAVCARLKLVGTYSGVKA